MKWIYDGLGGGHNGQYYWACSECGREDWWASYDDPNKLGIQCGKCEETKARKELKRLLDKYGEPK